MDGFRSADVFKGMGEADMTSLENFSKLKSLQPGQTVFKEGDAGDGLYFIIRGKIQISARVGDNQRRVFATFGPGEFFGEMAVLTMRRVPPTQLPKRFRTFTSFHVGTWPQSWNATTGTKRQ